MTATVTIPLWIAVLGGVLALWAVVSRLLLPGVRWFFRRRTNELIEKVNKRLDLRLPTIALTRRRVLINRLIYDPKVMRAIDRYCVDNKAPRDAVTGMVRRYANEIVPAFNAFAYFRIGSWFSKRIMNLLYRVRLGHSEDKHLRTIDPDSAVVVVMNHRSNIDYILVTYLALDRAALSYAVGEWARTWPIQQLVRALGAYFVRRGSGNELYRRVLECYVQMAVEGGATQAIFPEGRLSRDGSLCKPRIGLLDYMLRTFDSDGDRDIVFVPIGINYDRVLEDRTLLMDGDPNAERKTGFAAVRKSLRYMAHNLWLKMRGRMYSYGYACANFGKPISLKSYLSANNWNPKGMEREERIQHTMELAEDLMTHIGEIIPATPVSLICHLFVMQPERAFSEAELNRCAQELQDRLQSLGAHVYVPRDDPEYSVLVGLRMLVLRRLVLENDGKYTADPEQIRVLHYYANAISHLTNTF